MVLACLAFILVGGCSGPEPSQTKEADVTTQPRTIQQVEEVESPTDRPNIIFVLTDDLDYASIVEKMPEIGSLLTEEGVSFEEAFVSHPVCCPSRATFLTGLYDHNHNVLSNAPPDGGFQRFLSEGNEENTIAVRLQEEGGYRTAYFGKYMNGYPGEYDPTHVPPGWDEWYGELEKYEPYDYQINENGEIVSYGSETEDYFTDVLSGKATGFARRAASDPDRPFFAYVAPIAPHSPATPAERHEGRSPGRRPPTPPLLTRRTSLTSRRTSGKLSASRKKKPPTSTPTIGSAWSRC